MTKPLRQRVFTYITRHDQLLLLAYVDGSYTVPQLPGGTVKLGEQPADTAVALYLKGELHAKAASAHAGDCHEHTH